MPDPRRLLCIEIDTETEEIVRVYVLYAQRVTELGRRYAAIPSGSEEK